jgi:hypothetical protein
MLPRSYPTTTCAATLGISHKSIFGTLLHMAAEWI